MISHTNQKLDGNAIPRPDVIELDPALDALLIRLNPDGSYGFSIATDDPEMRRKLELAAYKIRSAFTHL